MRPGICIVVLGSALLFSPESSRAADLIVNGSFESGPGGSLPVYPGSTALTGWTVEIGSVDSAQGYQTHSGILCVDLDGYYDVGAISQSVSVVPGQSYLLDFWMAGNPDAGPTIKQMDVLWGGSSLGTLTFDITGKSPADMGWIEHQFVVQATGPQMILKFASLDNFGNAWGPMLDDVSLSPIPEPQVATLLGLSLAAGMWFRCRRSRAP